MVADRKLQLTLKKNGTRQQKTLEAQLLLYKDGERRSVSSRVAELDRLMPNYLGVSKAVLDNVIFCHQDESLWPMSESSTLKKKFDEIFEAQKYIKAIDNIKKVRKENNDNLKFLKERESKAKYIKDQGDKAEKESQRLSAEIEELKVEIKELAAKREEAGKKWQEASSHAAKYEIEAGRLANKRDQQKRLETNIQKLGENLKQRTESDEWLQSELDNYEARMANQAKLEKQQTEQYNVLIRSIEAARDKLRIKHSEIGRFQQQNIDNDQRIRQRNLMIQESAHRHNIRGYDTELDDMQISEYMERVLRLSKEQDANVEKARRETDREAKKARELLSKLGEQRSTLSEAKNSAKQQSAANDQRIAKFQSEFSEIVIDDSEKAIIEDKIADIDARLKKAKDDAKKASWESKINDGDKQLHGLKQESHHLNQEYNQAIDRRSELSSLDLYRRELGDRERSLEKTRAVNSDRLQVVVGKDWKPAKLEADFKKALDQKNGQVKEAERLRDTAAKDLEQINYKLSSAKTDLKRAEKEVAVCVQRLHESIEGEPEQYLENLAQLQRDRDHFKADLDNLVNMRKYFTRAREVLDDKHQCNLCSRKFHDEEEEKVFIQKLEKRMAKDNSEAENDLIETEADLRKAKEAGPSYDTWLRLSNKEIPRLQDDVKRWAAEREKVIREIEEHDKIVSDRIEARSDVEVLTNPVAKIAKYHQEIVDLAAKIEESNAKNKDVGDFRTIEDIRFELDALSSKSSNLRSNVDKMKVEKERSHAQVLNLQLDSSKAINELSDASHQLITKINLMKHIEELRTSNRQHRDKISRSEEQLHELTPQMVEEEAKLKDIEDRGSERAKGLREKASALSDDVHKLQVLEQDIAAYKETGGASNLQKCKREIDSLTLEIRNIEDEQKLVSQSINKIRADQGKHDVNKMTIQNNIYYRENLRELESVKSEIAQDSAHISEADGSGWQKQSKHWEHIFDGLKIQRIKKLSECGVKDNMLADLIKAWQVEYKEAALNFKKAHIEVETTKAAVEDLGRYGGALDKAIMKYHSIKMEEINRIIEELWKKTYQGTDVDTILIRSENETATANRSYNYRVCMTKQDTEMDMRGRCSAGQKVLASIIIRLALAECFGVNCGLIALDEPTTNLDRDNIRALAESLHEIIDTRRHQSNFQLIVITHDEEFLKFMKCPDFCDNYYRVFRDSRQKSQIDKQSISEVM
ncbi:DNA repair protein RAD50, partial [Lecanoromycetidae sp. Uapishka_2]